MRPSDEKHSSFIKPLPSLVSSLKYSSRSLFCRMLFLLWVSLGSGSRGGVCPDVDGVILLGGSPSPSLRLSTGRATGIAGLMPELMPVIRCMLKLRRTCPLWYISCSILCCLTVMAASHRSFPERREGCTELGLAGALRDELGPGPTTSPSIVKLT